MAFFSNVPVLGLIEELITGSGREQRPRPSPGISVGSRTYGPRAPGGFNDIMSRIGVDTRPPQSAPVRGGFRDLMSRLEMARDPAPPGGSAIEQPPGGVGGFGDIMQELLQLQDPSRYMMGQEDLEAQARAAAEAQYNPLIAALRQQMGQARRTGRAHKRELGDMFGSLSESLEEDIPDIQRMARQTKRRSGREFDELEESIQDRYAKSQQDQEEMMKRLNIEAAAPDILPEQMADRDFFSQMAQERKGISEQAMGQEERGAIQHTRRGSQLARVEGTQRQADLMDQLRELLGGFRSQIGAHEAAREQATTSGLGQLQSQMAQQAQQRAQQEFQNRMEMLGMEEQLRQGEFGREQDLREIAGGEEAFEGNIKNQWDIIPAATQRYGLSEAQTRQIYDALTQTIPTELRGNSEYSLGGINPLELQQVVEELIASGKLYDFGPVQQAALRDLATQAPWLR